MELKEKIEKDAVALCNKFGINRLCIFGSVARGSDTGDSDIDFLAEFDSPTPDDMPERYFGFIEEASRHFDREVQLITPRMLRNPHLIKSIEKDLIVVHE